MIFRKAGNIKLNEKRIANGSGWRDIQFFTLWFETNLGLYHISVVDHIKETPFEIISLSHCLMELYKSVNLQEVIPNNFDEKFQFPALKVG